MNDAVGTLTVARSRESFKQQSFLEKWGRTIASQRCGFETTD
ncbi:hypothetical protein POG22_03915 [Geitlerinema sp. CS-897]|nr:hypothetical protein [Geitlerinema sp. CS-897]